MTLASSKRAFLSPRLNVQRGMKPEGGDVKDSVAGNGQSLNKDPPLALETVGILLGTTGQYFCKGTPNQTRSQMAKACAFTNLGPRCIVH